MRRYGLCALERNLLNSHIHASMVGALIILHFVRHSIVPFYRLTKKTLLHNSQKNRCTAFHFKNGYAARGIFIGKSKTQNLQLLVVTLCNCLSVCLYASIQTYRYPNPLNIHDKSLPLDSFKKTIENLFGRDRAQRTPFTSPNYLPPSRTASGSISASHFHYAKATHCFAQR